MDPPQTWMPGRSSLAWAIRWPGVALSQEEMVMSPSKPEVLAWISTIAAMRSRDTRE